MAVKKKPEKPDDSIHVRLDNPTAIRKENLSLAIDIIGLLKRYYGYLEIKKQKEDLMKLLRADIAEIKRLARELDAQEMPVTMSRIISIESKAEKAPKKEPVEKIESPRKEDFKQAKAVSKPKKEPVKLQPKDKLETELEELKHMISSL